MQLVSNESDEVILRILRVKYNKTGDCCLILRYLEEKHVELKHCYSACDDEGTITESYFPVSEESDELSAVLLVEGMFEETRK